MSEGPILHIYKYGRKTELHTDACKQEYGAILLQEADDGKLHPVYYMSKKTFPQNKKDYAKKDLITRIARWALQLEEFDYEIEHRAGSRMKHVDALSRYPVMIIRRMGHKREWAVVPDFHKRNLFSDEAHFWLNGYVNKQNCRIWSEANPQVYVETPLHPEKLTVWCALWVGGILFQKR
ncbi:transposon Ty3-I Gag-Pol polyprotein [Trichonephila clavipes]|nr:transposon Ty3-I Gag-Pol polyprotein [Trichonephila clavipes]